MTTMRAVVNHGPRDYRLQQIPIPTPASGEALIKVEAVGICASDLKCYSGAPKFWGDDTRPAWVEHEVVPGHEFVGRVVSLDDEARERWGVEVGDRVTSEQIVPCWNCAYCRRGLYHLCAPHDIYGFKRRAPGAMAEYMIFPSDSLVHRIADSLEPAHAAFVEPLSCALHAVQRATIDFEDVVVVAGCGPIGLGMIAGSAAKSPRAVVALDLAEHKLDLARRCGATHTVNVGSENPRALIDSLTEGLGADVYLEGSGHPSAVPQGLDLLRKRGRFIEYSVFKDPVTVDWTIISDDKELDVLGAHLGPGCWPAAVRMLESGVLPIADIVTHQLPLERFQEGLDLVGDGSASIKVALIP